MTSSKAKLFIFINILSVIKVSLLETVHFTNSPNKILKANNFTTYKVEVPNGEPITIIEANTALIDKKIDFNQLDNGANKYSKHHHSNERRKQVINLENSLSMTVTPNRNYEYENSAAAMGDEESVTNDYSNLSHERNQKRKTSIKTVYSPELLQQFLKDYANKIQAATSVASIEATSSQQHIFPSIQQHNSGSIELDQNISNNNENEEKDKYESIETAVVEEEAEATDDGNRRVSNVSTGDKESTELNDIQQRKNYRPNGHNNNNQHPYNKNNGWVTLDAVPWSKSKVSKWQSSANKYGSQGNYNYQNNNYNNQRPSSSYRPSNNNNNNNYDYDYNGGNNNNNDDDYYAQRPSPSKPTYHNNQFYSTGYQSNNRPQHTSPPQDSWYQSSSHHQSGPPPPSYNNYDDNYSRPPSNRPEIITDNRPSNFPSHHEDHHRPSNRPEYSYHGGNYHSYKDAHPPTYPHSGEGEWVLVSTTKGYQFPKRGQKAMSFVAQNGFNNDGKYTDHKGIITAAASESQNVETYARPPHRAGPTKITQQQVKLTVLPLFVNKNQANQNYNNDNDVNMGVYKPLVQTYDGLIETAQSNQTVEESAANANQANALTTSHKPKKKRKVVKKNYYMRKNSGQADTAGVIAAVGASLLPASLGLIAPMVLG